MLKSPVSQGFISVCSIANITINQMSDCHTGFITDQNFSALDSLKVQKTYFQLMNNGNYTFLAQLYDNATGKTILYRYNQGADNIQYYSDFDFDHKSQERFCEEDKSGLKETNESSKFAIPFVYENVIYWVENLQVKALKNITPTLLINSKDFDSTGKLETIEVKIFNRGDVSEEYTQNIE